MCKLVPALVLLSSVCTADTLVNVQFTNVPSTTYNGTFNGFVTVTVGTAADGTGGLPGQSLICDDQAHTTTVPSPVLPYDYSVINPSSPAIANARFLPADSGAPFAGETQTQLYEEAAIVLYNFTQAVAPNAETIAQYQYALWNLMNGANTDLNTHLNYGVFGSADAENATDNNAVLGIQGAAKAALLANTSLDSQIYGELRIYTPAAAAASDQEYLQLTPAPEPAYIGAAGFLLFGMGFAAHRRRKLQGQNA